MSLFKVFTALFVTACFSANAWTQPLPLVAPQSVGFQPETLYAMQQQLNTLVDQQRLPGVVSLVARKGQVVHLQAYGTQIGETPLQTDSLFRIYSMTKPITAAAILMLWEQGKCQLDDPVAKYLPLFNAPKVYVEHDNDGALVTRPATRDITIRDLLSHTAGLGYGFLGNTEVDKLIMSQGVFTQPLTGAIDTLATIPLVNDPGQRWVYSLASDVQGRLIEVISGQSFPQFLQQHIFEPLAMHDTAFQLNQQQQQRLSDLYWQPEQGPVVPYRQWLYSDYSQPPLSYSGGGGLVSSISDYYQFAQMLANGGVLNGTRLLKPSTVAMMTSDQLPADAPDIFWPNSGQRFGFGLGVVSKSTPKALRGQYYWAGMANSVFWVDPEQELVAIIMVNVMAKEVLPLKPMVSPWLYKALIN